MRAEAFPGRGNGSLLTILFDLLVDNGGHFLFYIKCYNIRGQWSLSDKTGAPKPFRNKNSTSDMGQRNSGETEDFCKFSINGFMKAAGNTSVTRVWEKALLCVEEVMEDDWVGNQVIVLILLEKQINNAVYLGISCTIFKFKTEMFF